MKTEPFTFKITIHAPPYEGSGDFQRCVHASEKLHEVFRDARMSLTHLLLMDMAKNGDAPEKEPNVRFRKYLERKIAFVDSLIQGENIERPADPTSSP